MSLWDLKMGPEKNLRSYDEFLLCLTELKLGLLNRDLAYRSSISEGLCSNICHCWFRAIALYLQYFVSAPGIGMINVTSPKRSHQYRNLIRIIGCGEVFIETPKDLELPSATWSEYEPHMRLCETSKNLLILISLLPKYPYNLKALFPNVWNNFHVGLIFWNFWYKTNKSRVLISCCEIKRGGYTCLQLLKINPQKMWCTPVLHRILLLGVQYISQI